MKKVQQPAPEIDLPEEDVPFDDVMRALLAAPVHHKKATRTKPKLKGGRGKGGSKGGGRNPIGAMLQQRKKRKRTRKARKTAPKR